MPNVLQLRHPDATPTAFSIFGFVAILISIEAVLFYFDNRWMYGLFLTSYVIMTVYLAFNTYYVGVSHIDTMFIAKVMCNTKQKVTN